jgi:hypothetical protein
MTTRSGPPAADPEATWISCWLLYWEVEVALAVSPSTIQAIPDGRLAAENASVDFDTRQEETEAGLAFCQCASGLDSRDAS